MLNNYLRSIIKKSGVYYDYSLTAQTTSDFFSCNLSSEDYLYIGQFLPFNNIFIEMQTVNTNTSIISADILATKGWSSVVDILDATSGFIKNGVIQWTINRTDIWKEVLDTSIEGMGLDDFNIYNLHWIRVKTNNAFSTATTIKRIRYKFTDDLQLSTLDPDINNIKTAWDANKTDWTDQILTASESVVLDLKNRKILQRANQILRFDELYLPTAYKTLSIIYGALGNEYIDKRDDSRAQYSSLISKLNLTIDDTKDGHVTKSKISNSTYGVYR